MSKRSKQLKTTKTIKLQWIASIWRHNDKNVELRRNAFKTTQNYKSDHITMTCIDLMSKHQNNSKLQKWSNYNELHRFDVITIKNVELRRNAFKTTQNYKSDQITMTCIDLMSKHQTNSKLQKRSNYNVLHRFDVKTIKNVELRRKTFKTTQNYKTIKLRFHVKTIKTTCIDLTSNDQKCWVTSQCIQNNAKLQKWSNYDEFASIWRQNDQNNSKLQKRSNYNELQFDVITIKMLSYVAMHSKQHKTTKVIKLQWTCIYLMSKHSKQPKTTKVIKLQWICIDLTS